MTKQHDETHAETLSRIMKEIDAERARRPDGGYATRCERCRFWIADKPKEGWADEDQEGECHRYAPRITHVHSIEALGKIAWAIEKLANIEHDRDFDYAYARCIAPANDWQKTAANDWCGEFKPRDAGQ